MAGKLLQSLMLLCLALACYGYLRLFMRAFRLPWPVTAICACS